MAENPEHNPNTGNQDSNRIETPIGGIDFDMPKHRSNVIKVIGVGGGGGNAINHMYEAGINGVDFAICNTDSQALQNSPVPNKIQLGVSLTEGLGAGANPEVGEQAAMESMEEIKAMMEPSTKMVFITAGMGGGTGTGAAPVIAKVAREMEILTVGIVTMPFQFEGVMRCKQAQIGIDKLRQNVDSLIVVNNNKLREIYGNLGFRAGFAKADEVLAIAAKGIAEVITHHYMQNIDLRDAKTVLSNSGTAIMGSAESTGSERAKEAIVKALDSPLLNDNKITGAKNVLLLIVSGSQEITIDEIGEINDHIQIEAGYGANIIMGIGEDDSLGEAISVTIIATGFNANQQSGIANIEEKKIIHQLSQDSGEGSKGLEESPSAAHEAGGDSTTPNPSDADPYKRAEELMKDDKGEIKTQVAKPASEEPTERTVYHLEEDRGSAEQEPSAERSTLESIDVRAEEVQPVQATEEEPTALSILRELPVVYETVEPVIEATDAETEGDDFVIIESTDLLRNMEVVDAEFVDASETLLQTTLEFDRPLSDVTREEEDREHTVVFDLSENIKEMPVSYQEIEDEEPRLVVRDEEEAAAAENYLAEEARLMAAKAQDTSSSPATKKEDANPIINKTSTEVLSEPRASVQGSPEGNGDDPFFKSISDTSSRTKKNARALKEYNYRFRNNRTSIEDIENEPAYKRQGIDLDEASSEPNISRTSISEDTNNEVQIRSNNSFLHDNVD